METVNYKLTHEELEQITNIFEKKSSLENLIKIMDTENEVLYEKLVSDYGKVLKGFQAWWDMIFKEHSISEGDYKVDFINSCLVETDLNL